jgi:hypothetical protein
MTFMPSPFYGMAATITQNQRQLFDPALDRTSEAARVRRVFASSAVLWTVFVSEVFEIYLIWAA